MDYQYIIEQHYGDLQPQKFIGLAEQIQQLYDGPWVQLGPSPDEGTTNPNPADQEKARKMWRKAYKLLQPYEKLINEDYQEMQVDSLGVYLDKERQAILAMYKLCDAYHNEVELWDQMQEDSDPIVEQEYRIPEQVQYNRDKAKNYFSLKEQLFKNQHFPIEKDRLSRWWNRVPEEKQEEALKIRQKAYEKDLKNSGFFDYYDVEISPDVYVGAYDFYDSYQEANRQLEDCRFICIIQDLNDGIDVLNIEKLERYIWENQKRLSDEQIFAFLTYEEMKTYLPDLMRKSSADAFANEIVRSLKEDDQLKAKAVGNTGILENEIDGKTGFFKLEVFELGDKPQTEEHTPDVPAIFVPILHSNAKAWSLFLKILTQIEPRINKKEGARTDKWQWPHVCDAWKDLKLIDADTNPTAFGQAIHSIINQRTEASVTQTFKFGRIKKNYPTVTDNSIIAEIAKLFLPVKDIIKSAQSAQ